jgi:hypothetical protein
MDAVQMNKILKHASKSATFKIEFLHEIQMRRFTMRKGDVWECTLIDKGRHNEGCTADNYINAVRNGEGYFQMDRSPVPVAAVRAIGWKCYRALMREPIMRR